MKLTIGTRGSELALWQAEWAKNQISIIYPDAELSVKIIKTEGDIILDVALSKIGDKGLFTKAIEDALIEGSIDIAVHSLKDLPTTLTEGLCIGAVSKREDQRDAFISFKYNSIDELPENAVVATGSLRRKCQLLNYRKDLIISDIRGNINTRLRKLESEKLDAMILAKAGLVRLGIDHIIKQTIPENVILPAVSQGVMAIESRTADQNINMILSQINNKESFYAVTAERAMLKTLEGGCQVPIGVYTSIENNEIVLDAMIGSLNGENIIKCRMKADINDAEELGIKAGTYLLKRGGSEILSELRKEK